MSAPRRRKQRPNSNPPAPLSPAPEGSTRWWESPWGIAAAVSGVGLVVRCLHYLLMRDAAVYQVLIGDSWQYDQWAQRIAGGQWIGTEVFYQTPLYPYFLAVLYAVFGHHVWVVRLVQALLGAVACGLLANTGQRLFSPLVGWAAGLLLALYPPAIFFDGIVQKASLDMFLMSLLLWLVAVCQATPNARRLLALGIVVGALVLNRENAAVLVPVLGVWIGWLLWQKGAGVVLLREAAFVGGIALVLVPVGLRNQYVGGEFLLTTSQMGPNFYIGNNKNANGRYESLRPYRGDPRYEQQDARVMAEADMGTQLTPGEVSRYWMQRSFADIREAPTRWLKLLGLKSVLTVHTYEVTDGESLEHHAGDSLVLRLLGFGLHFGVIVPLAAAGLYWSRKDWRRLWVYYALIAAFAAAVAVFYVFARYRYPLVPLLILFAAVGLVGAWHYFRQRNMSGREFVIGAGLAGLLLIPSNWPLQVADDNGVTWFNIGTSFSDEGQTAQAMAAFEQSLAINPNFPPAYQNMGIAAMKAGDLERARASLQKAIELDPGLAAAYVNLGQAWYQAGDRESAMANVQQAIQIDPLLYQAHQLAGRLLMEEGQYAAAVESFQRALETSLGEPAVRADLGMAQIAAGNAATGLQELEVAAQAAPHRLDFANNLAWSLATCHDSSVRDPARALAVATEVCEATQQQVPEFLDTLAAAQAANGDFAAAVATMDRVLEIATGNIPASSEADLKKRRELYRNQQPYIEAPPAGR